MPPPEDVLLARSAGGDTDASSNNKKTVAVADTAEQIIADLERLDLEGSAKVSSAVNVGKDGKLDMISRMFNDTTTADKEGKKREPLLLSSPADHFQNNRLRTSALAHKTNTMIMYGGGNKTEIYDELRKLTLNDADDKSAGNKEQTGNNDKSKSSTQIMGNKAKIQMSKDEGKDSGTEEDDEKYPENVTEDIKQQTGENKEEKKDGSKKEEEEEDEQDGGDKGQEETAEGELIGRTPGPVSATRVGRQMNNHPYAGKKAYPTIPFSLVSNTVKPVVAPGLYIDPNPANFFQAQRQKQPAMSMSNHNNNNNNNCNQQYNNINNIQGNYNNYYEPCGQDIMDKKVFGGHGGMSSCEYENNMSAATCNNGMNTGGGQMVHNAGVGYNNMSPCAAWESEESKQNNKFHHQTSTAAHHQQQVEQATTNSVAAAATGGPSPFADGIVSTEELSRLLDAPDELPDDLSDFILKYSRRYSTDTPPISGIDEWTASRKSSTSDNNSNSGSSSPKHGPSRANMDPCDSPLGAGSAPQPSPAQPKGAQAPPTPPTPAKQGMNKSNLKTILPKQQGKGRKGEARDRLRSMFSEKDNEIACLWAVKCIQSCPGALYFRDPDGDSLLHIVVWHKDLPKIYALVELMLKTEYSPRQKPFDLPNRLHETPLFLAVEKREEEVVSYLLECGADPNFQTRKTEADGPLHYAAARGMTEIVDVLTAHPNTDKNLRNGLGLTPLLNAVKNHGVIEEESQCLVNNKPTIRALLKAGADPKIPDAQNGKTVLHYSVERMDPELIEIYADNLDADVMREVVNIGNFDGDTPMTLLQRMGGANAGGGGGGLGRAEDELRNKMMETLLAAGAHQHQHPHHMLTHPPQHEHHQFQQSSHPNSPFDN